MSPREAPSGGSASRAREALVQGARLSRRDVQRMSSDDLHDALDEHADVLTERRYDLDDLHEDIDLDISTSRSRDDYRDRNRDGGVGLGTVLGVGAAGYVAWSFRHYIIGYLHRFLSRTPQGQLERSMAIDRFQLQPRPILPPALRPNPNINPDSDDRF